MKRERILFLSERFLALLLALAAYAPHTAHAKPFGYEVSPSEKPKFDLPLSPFATEVLGNTGGHTRNLSLKVPPARSGHTPQLRLEYSAGDRDSLLGYGWSLPVPEIKRNLADGVPTYSSVSTHLDRLAFSLPEAKGELVWSATDPNGFAPRRADPFANFTYHPASDHWTADTTTGVKWFFGLSADARESDPALSTRVFSWKASSAVDRYDPRLGHVPGALL